MSFFGNTQDSFLDNVKNGYGINNGAPWLGGAAGAYGGGTGFSNSMALGVDYATALAGGNWVRVGSYNDVVRNGKTDNKIYSNDGFRENFSLNGANIDFITKIYYVWNSYDGEGIDGRLIGSTSGFGIGLNMFGDNILTTRGKTAGATPGTSMASRYFRNTNWGKREIPKRIFKELPKRLNFGILGNTSFRSSTWGALAGRSMSIIGRGFVGVSIGMSVYNVATAENTTQAIVVEGVGMAGALAGAEFGAALGTMIFPGAGTIIGGVIGGGIGYVFGQGVGKDIYD